MQGLVKLTKTHVQLYGGAPQGRDQLHKTIATWAGWRRSPAAVSLPDGGGRCSLYQGRLWSSTIIPLFVQQSIALDWDGETKKTLGRIVDQLQAGMVELDPPSGHSPELRWDDEWKRQPMPHQVQAIRCLRFLNYRALLADDMGLGKTATSIWAWQQSGAPRLLVVCPATVKYNWQRELWATLNEVNVHLVDGTPKQRASIFSEIQHAHVHDEGRAAVIINYDLLHRLADREQAILISWATEQFLVLDESHYVKNRKAERTKFIFDQLAPDHGGATGRLCLTGTPIRNTSEDLWAQIQIVRPGCWSSFHQFEKLHLQRAAHDIEVTTKEGKTKDVTLRPVRRIKHREQLNAVVNTLQIRRKKEDVLNLPEKIHTYPDFELDKPTAKIYRAMKELALIELAELGDDTPIFHPQAKSALEATLRLEQIAQGFLGGIPEPYLEKVTPLLKHAEKIDGRPGHLIFPKSIKIQWLSETIDSILLQGGQPVIFSRFNTPLFWLTQQWPDSAILHGGLKPKQRTELIDRFQDHGLRVLWVQVKIAEGFNLTSSQDCIFYGRDWSPAVNFQAEDRLHRIGQQGTVNVQIPIVRGTFEVYLHKKLAAKARDAEVSLRSVTIGELRKAL